MPILYQAHRDRTAVLLLAMDRALPTLAEVAPGGEVSAMLELSDVAPVTMREPVRGLLWITGWLRALSRNQARRASARWAEQRPDSRLLDVGHTANLLWLATTPVRLASELYGLLGSPAAAQNTR
jgi:hypothetical protein